MSIVLENVSYGPYARNTLDVYRPETSNRTPAVIYMHGGGYRRGDKQQFGQFPLELKELCAQAGITFISANYRFIETDPFPAPMEDGKRAIQFVRYMAEEWNLNPDQLVVTGASAGAHIMLWNALKGEQADPESDDPVSRTSSKVAGVACFRGQASKDQQFYDPIYGGDQIQPNLRMFYGVDEKEELDSPLIRKLSYEASAINFVSEQAPPALMIYNNLFSEPFIPAETSLSDVIHHPIHGYLLKQKMDQHGRTCLFRHAGDPIVEGELLSFLQRCFAGSA